VRDLLDQGVPGEVIRFVMLSTHYRKPMDWTEKKREEAEKTLRKIAQLFSEPALSKPWLSSRLANAPQEFVDALASDLNTSLALSLINKYLKNSQEAELAASLQLMGFEPDALVAKFAGIRMSTHSNEHTSGVSAEVRESSGPEWNVHTLQSFVSRFQKVREEAMQSKDFTEVDRLKAALMAAGVEVQMSKTGVDLKPAAGFDPAKLERLL
jgi:cysteinyl-tRNA synthetase